MTWTWKFETAIGDEVGRSEVFESRGDAESWVGETFGQLVEDGIDQVRLFDGDTEVYGPMSLHAENS
ncbi:hypothetical protein [Aeromicrobium sp.]|uniref:hypothetical protein n=1 Tax=Aeromicrobium sp. TaxID=1871063 RepID=UPI0019CCAAE8|nr:hypothetical protein [Aeromicrobium sp.]MBC7629956.1 hypothetical protein [Aeromicrobium sp.]